MSLVQFNGSPDLIIATVYYAGTNTLREGAPVYYDLDDTNAPVIDSWDPSVDPISTVTVTGNRNLRGNRVFDVNANGSTGSGGVNTGQLAGVVASSSSGKVGPGFIDIVRPIRGTVCNVLVNYNTALKGDIVLPDETTPSNTFGNGTAKYVAAGAAPAVNYLLATGAIQVMQAGPTSLVTPTNPATVLARFL